MHRTVDRDIARDNARLHANDVDCAGVEHVDSNERASINEVSRVHVSTTWLQWAAALAAGAVRTCMVGYAVLSPSL